jgi:hypothetical protein
MSNLTALTAPDAKKVSLVAAWYGFLDKILAPCDKPKGR